MIVRLIARIASINVELARHIASFGFIYFTELFLLWLITGSGDNSHFNPELFKICNVSIDVIKFQTFGFLVGGFIFGRRGERRKLKNVDRIVNLRWSLGFYIIGAVLSLFASFLIAESGNSTSVNWWFGISRLLTCLGISGGIGINLTIINALSRKENHSASLLLFTGIGVLGTVVCCLIIFFGGYAFRVSILDSTQLVIGISIVLGVFGLWMLQSKSKLAEETIHENTNDYTYNINFKGFSLRVISFVVLGLPTFYLAGILASKASRLKDNGWFSLDLSKLHIGDSDNILSAYFLGIQYFGFFLICFLFRDGKRITYLN